VREVSDDQLVEESLPRLRRMLGFGTTTCEVKSGYGLDPDNEMKILRAASRLDSVQPVKIVPTFLGAHAFPPEYEDDHEGYVDLVIEKMIPLVAREKLASACDAYVDKGVFSTEQAGRIFQAARDHGLAVHIHAGQFEDLGGPELAASMGALSADHLDVVSDEGLEAMARQGCIAVMLPGASVSLGQEPPRVERMIEAGVKVALATDCNPGTSYSENLSLMAFMACTRMGLPVDSALVAITRHAAAALGLAENEGTITARATADLVVHGVADWREILYHFGVSHVRHVVIDGKLVYSAR
jgi:imidazolonepropionase